MMYVSGNVRHLYMFAASTIGLDQPSARRLFPLAWQKLRTSNPTFRHLFDQVDKRSDAVTMAATRSFFLDDFTNSFQNWLQTRGVYVNNIENLISRQVFMVEDEAKDIRSRSNYKWAVGFYFDVSFRR